MQLWIQELLIKDKWEPVIELNLGKYHSIIMYNTFLLKNNIYLLICSPVHTYLVVYPIE